MRSAPALRLWQVGIDPGLDVGHDRFLDTGICGAEMLLPLPPGAIVAAGESFVFNNGQHHRQRRVGCGAPSTDLDGWAASSRSASSLSIPTGGTRNVRRSPKLPPPITVFKEPATLEIVPSFERLHPTDHGLHIDQGMIPVGTT